MPKSLSSISTEHKVQLRMTGMSAFKCFIMRLSTRLNLKFRADVDAGLKGLSDNGATAL